MSESTDVPTTRSGAMSRSAIVRGCSGSRPGKRAIQYHQRLRAHGYGLAHREVGHRCVARLPSVGPPVDRRSTRWRDHGAVERADRRAHNKVRDVASVEPVTTLGRGDETGVCFLKVDCAGSWPSEN
ncbi:MAG TPA: hypothetical protein VM677_33580, partial [Actinokineospora sp.]|nr:hypothetical protein [Actinokineospora sp.]